MSQKDLFERSKKVVPGGVHSPVRSFKGLHTTPRFIDSAQGAYIHDEDQKDYIDFCMSFGPLILGHRHPTVLNALHMALEKGWSFGACERYSLELAEFLINKIDHIEQIRFVNSGTEAVMTAVRLARGITKRAKIIKFDGCYHGHLDDMLIKAGSGLAAAPEASSDGVTEQTASNTLICPLGDIQAVSRCFDDYPGQIAAIVIEPLPANNGLLPQQQQFLEQLRAITQKNDSLLVFDEVISGFRVSFGGMSELTSITPDLVTYGKIIGGGLPVGAVAASRVVMEHLAPVGNVYQAGTLSANPLAMVAGLSTLKELNADFYKQLESQSQRITKLFSNWLEQKGFEDYKVIRQGSLFWLTPTHDNLYQIEQMPKNLTTRFYSLFETLLDKGIYLSPNAYEIGFVSIAHDPSVIDELEQRLWTS